MTSNEQISVIYINEIRSMIVRLLSMYDELSLPQISKIMRKNKTTIQYHLQILRDSDIILVSRESQADSRGSIATKYYKLKDQRKDQHVFLEEFKKIKDLEKRFTKYTNYIELLNAGIKDLVNRISYAEKGVQKSLERIDQLSGAKLTKAKLDELHEYLKRTNPGFSIIAVPAEVFLQISKNVRKLYEEIEKTTKEYMQKEKTLLQNQNLSEGEIKEIMRTDFRHIEGHEIITIMLPLKELIDTLIDN